MVRTAKSAPYLGNVGSDPSRDVLQGKWVAISKEYRRIDIAEEGFGYFCRVKGFQLPKVLQERPQVEAVASHQSHTR